MKGDLVALEESDGVGRATHGVPKEGQAGQAEIRLMLCVRRQIRLLGAI